jgi:hypothetical protein
MASVMIITVNNCKIYTDTHTDNVLPSCSGVAREVHVGSSAPTPYTCAHTVFITLPQTVTSMPELVHKAVYMDS